MEETKRWADGTAGFGSASVLEALEKASEPLRAHRVGPKVEMKELVVGPKFAEMLGQKPPAPGLGQKPPPTSNRVQRRAAERKARRGAR